MKHNEKFSERIKKEEREKRKNFGQKELFQKNIKVEQCREKKIERNQT